MSIKTKTNTVNYYVFELTRYGSDYEELSIFICDPDNIGLTELPTSDFTYKLDDHILIRISDLNDIEKITKMVNSLVNGNLGKMKFSYTLKYN